MTPLQLAVEEENLPIVQLLLARQEVNPNIRSVLKHLCFNSVLKQYILTIFVIKYCLI